MSEKPWPARHRNRWFHSRGGRAGKFGPRWGTATRIAKDTNEYEFVFRTSIGGRYRRTYRTEIIPLARWLDEKLLLINGEGLQRCRAAMGEQTNLRRLGEAWTAEGFPRTGVPPIPMDGDGVLVTLERTTRPHRSRQNAMIEVMTIPYPALVSAGVVFDSIRPIEITGDTNTTEERILDDAPVEPMFFGKNPPKNATVELVEGQSSDERQMWEIAHKGERWRVGRHLRREPGATRRAWVVDTSEIFVWKQPMHGSFAWQRVRHMRTGGQQRWAWTENIHRLGAVVFSAVSELDGKRHRFISGFDTQEATPMYFLAQLPDKGRCRGYDDAIDLLAPEIVRQARAEGRAVQRQGDVFAIETNLTDEEVYRRAKFRVRRRVVLQDPELMTFQNMVQPEPYEVHEKVDCPYCGCGKKHRVGYGEKARRALMIHGTAHTASEVVVCAKGVTFIRGTMYHDPMLEQRGRQPEHQRIELDTGEARRNRSTNRSVALPADSVGKWFLAVRNTVPRQGRRRQQPPTMAVAEAADAALVAA